MAEKKAKEQAEADARRAKPGKIAVPSIKIDAIENMPRNQSEQVSLTDRPK